MMVLLAGLVIESLAHTTTLIHNMGERKQHVHADRNAR